MGGAKQVIQGMSSGEGGGTASEGNESKGKEPRTREETEMRERLIERPGGEEAARVKTEAITRRTVFLFFCLLCSIHKRGRRC